MWPSKSKLWWIGKKYVVIYTIEYYSSISFKKWNNAICSNMDGPRGNYTEPNQKKTNIWCHLYMEFFFLFFFISWRLITLQYCSGFCHTLTWISHGYTCIPHPDPPSHIPLHPIPLGLPSVPGLREFFFLMIQMNLLTKQ